MKKLQIFPILFLLLLALLSGCDSLTPRRKASPLQMVTQVQVVCRRGTATMKRNYTQPQKMEPILNYLRLLKYKGLAHTDPERLIGNSFEITLYYSNGQQRIYRQRADRFLSKNSHPWEQIDPDQASLLFPILQSMTSDL